MNRHLTCILVALFSFGPAAAADIVILGEVHDNPRSHELQAAELLSLRPTAVVFEMLSPAEAAQINRDTSSAETVWNETNWPEFELYAPIFSALGDAELVGAATPRDVISRVFAEGPSVAFAGDAQRFGLTIDLPQPEQRAREVLQFEAHCEAMPIEMMGGMVAVQRFRDATFAHAALKALASYGPPVAIVTGAGHARTDWGVPAMIAHAAPDVTTRSVAFIEEDDGTPFDEVVIVPKPNRDDPCDVFN